MTFPVFALFLNVLWDRQGQTNISCVVREILIYSTFWREIFLKFSLILKLFCVPAARCDIIVCGDGNCLYY